MAVVCLLATLLALSNHRAYAGDIQFRLHEGALHVTGLSQNDLEVLASLKLTSRDWRKLLPVFVGDRYPQDLTQTPPMLGDYRIIGAAIVFRPRFSFEAGRSYLTRLDISATAALMDDSTRVREPGEFVFSIPADGSEPSTSVTHVYPTSEVVPDNLLKVYIHFSGPMSRVNVHDYIQLKDEQGRTIPLPFVEIETGLWDARNQRLTLIFHPGRIKRGVGPNMAMGTVFEAGKSYQLDIDGRWPDAFGRPLLADFVKRFQATEADRRAPDISRWDLRVPAVKTKEPLQLRFAEALDHGLLLRMIAVLDSSGHVVEGEVEVGAEETSWRLQPKDQWHAGAYSVTVNTLLEDLAGNSLRGVFDRHAAGKDEIDTRPFTEIPFEITEH